MISVGDKYIVEVESINLANKSCNLRGVYWPFSFKMINALDVLEKAPEFDESRVPNEISNQHDPALKAKKILQEKKKKKLIFKR